MVALRVGSRSRQENDRCRHSEDCSGTHPPKTVVMHLLSTVISLFNQIQRGLLVDRLSIVHLTLACLSQRNP